jgi:hypothetical protein
MNRHGQTVTVPVLRRRSFRSVLGGI